MTSRGTIAAVAVGITMFGTSLALADSGRPGPFDRRITSWAVDHRTGSLTRVFRTVTLLGSSPVLLAVTVAFGGLLVRHAKSWQPMITMGAGLLIANLSSNLIKNLVDRPRPPMTIWLDHPAGAAFPSGHSAQATAFWLVAAVVVTNARSRRTRLATLTAATLVVVAVMSSRVYLGVHWSTDVVGGAGLGMIIATLIYWGRSRSLTRQAGRN